MGDSQDHAICRACGTQFDVPLEAPPTSCHICDDPRQFVPKAGQAWTSLRELRSSGFENTFQPDEVHPDMTFIFTEHKASHTDRQWSGVSIHTPQKVGIGQRAILLETTSGNVLWDCIAYLDQKTIDFINKKGGLKAIVISHPHFYTTHLEWAATFRCPVYLASDDQEWLSRIDAQACRRFLSKSTEEIVPGVTAIKAGGHFPGSLVLHWDKRLMVADTMMATPSGLYHVDRVPGTTSYSFMWSYPNMIPLTPDAIHGIWKAVKPLDFEETFGAFHGTEIRDKKLRSRVLESMKIQVKAGGHSHHDLFQEYL